MVHYNPPYNWVVSHPLYTLNNYGFFIAQYKLKVEIFIPNIRRLFNHGIYSWNLIVLHFSINAWLSSGMLKQVFIWKMVVSPFPSIQNWFAFGVPGMYHTVGEFSSLG